MTEIRFALVMAHSRREVHAYLPDNYGIVGDGEFEGQQVFVIAGLDSYGWTLDEYVIPRYTSGSIACREVSREVAQRFDNSVLVHGKEVRVCL